MYNFSTLTEPKKNKPCHWQSMLDSSSNLTTPSAIFKQSTSISNRKRKDSDFANRGKIING